LFWGWVKSVTKGFFHVSQNSTFFCEKSNYQYKAVLKGRGFYPIF
jgi:hypothetical protein